VGSLNVDYLAAVDRLPRAGETVPGRQLQVRFGGKGANQAVAAARQDARVSMIGCLGGDAMGRAYLRHLQREGIEHSGVRVLPKTSTGAALIGVDHQGENQIIVIPGANGLLGRGDLQKQDRLFRRAKLFIVQFEVPLAALVAAMRLASRHQLPIMLNPAPFRPDFPWGDFRIEFLVVNQSEASALFGRVPATLDSRGARALRRALQSMKVANLVITRGALPTWFVNPERALSIPALKVKAVDTVGAGDAFIGTLGARLAAGESVEQALLCANAAGALATLAAGAQEALPTRAATDRAARRLLARGV
jgi:ribokinase